MEPKKDIKKPDNGLSEWHQSVIDQDLMSLLRKHVGKPSVKGELVELIMQQVRDGESSAFRLLGKALTEPTINEDYLDITDEQFRQIILLAADRIRRDEETRAVKKS